MGNYENEKLCGNYLLLLRREGTVQYIFTLPVENMKVLARSTSALTQLSQTA